MTMLEESFMRIVPNAIRDIAKTLEERKTRLVCVCKNGENENYVNPACVSFVRLTDGIVYVGVDGDTFRTDYRTTAEALKALGME